MEVLTLQVFVSLMLVLGSVVLFATSVVRRDHEHADRLSLLPMNHDEDLEAEEQNRHDHHIDPS